MLNINGYPQITPSILKHLESGAHLNGPSTDGVLCLSHYSRVSKCACWEFYYLHQLYRWPPCLPHAGFRIYKAVLSMILKYSICKYSRAWHIYSGAKNKNLSFLLSFLESWDVQFSIFWVFMKSKCLMPSKKIFYRDSDVLLNGAQRFGGRGCNALPRNFLPTRQMIQCKSLRMRYCLCQVCAGN